jgi:hypothetical protein
VLLVGVEEGAVVVEPVVVEPVVVEPVVVEPVVVEPVVVEPVVVEPVVVEPVVVEPVVVEPVVVEPVVGDEAVDGGCEGSADGLEGAVDGEFVGLADEVVVDGIGADGAAVVPEDVLDGFVGASGSLADPVSTTATPPPPGGAYEIPRPRRSPSTRLSADVAAPPFTLVDAGAAAAAADKVLAKPEPARSARGVAQLAPTGQASP